MQSKRKDTQYLPYLLAFFLCFLLCLHFPYTGDDWVWGSQTGLLRLQKLFVGYNGRYLGNLLVLALTRSVWLRSFCMAAVLTGICAAVRQIVGRPWAFWLTALLLLCMPKRIGAQAVVWTAGFSNYSVSAFLSLLYVAFLSRKSTCQTGAYKLLASMGLFVLGFSSCLFLETVTLCTLFLSLAVLLYRFVRRERVSVPLVCHGFGAMLGTLLMFSNSAYQNVWKHSDSYRSVLSGGLFQQCKNNYFEAIYPYGYFLNILLNLALFICCLTGFLLLRNRIKGLLPRFALAVHGCFAFYALFTVLILPEAKTGLFLLAEAGFCLAGLLCSFAVVLILVHVGGESARRNKAILCMASIILLMAPLFAVNPVTPRCFFPSYLYFIVLVCLMAELCETLLRQQAARGTAESNEVFFALARIGQRALLLGLALVYVLYLGVFLSIHRADQRRLAYIRNAVSEGRQEIEIVHLPYELFLNNPTPPDNNWATHYKAFYELPQELQLIPSYTYPAEESVS